MISALLFQLWLILVNAVPGSEVPTLRVDYYHTGNSKQELFSLDSVVVEPLPWPGNLSRNVDDTNLGKYLFEVVDRATNQVLYSRGFASIYGEWETTPEAQTVNRTFHESLRFPQPQLPVQIVLKKRDRSNAFREVWSLNLEPDDIYIDSSRPPEPGPLLQIQASGDPADKVDFLILGDGYTAAERDKCESDARRLNKTLFSTEPFARRSSDFNVWLLCPAAAESGVSRPSSGIHRNSPAGTSYDAFGSERYILTFENRKFRELASYAPYEFVEILVNQETYGGGGIFGLYGTVAADNAFASYVFIHELGHHFAGLADEYYTSPVAYQAKTDRVEPWEPNVTALLDPHRLKWGDLVAADTPLPTPWAKEAFEEHARETQKQRAKIREEAGSESEMNALFQEQKQWETELFSQEPHRHTTGAFEGAIYEARGYFRPQLDCIMFSRNDVPFCRVCQRAIERVIDLYVP